MKKRQANSLENLICHSNNENLKKSCKYMQENANQQIDQNKVIIRNSLSDLLDLPNNLSFLYNEQFLEHLTIIIRQIYKRYFQIKQNYKCSTFTKHLLFIFQSVCEQIIQEQNQVFDKEKQKMFERMQEISPNRSQNVSVQHLQKELEISSKGNESLPLFNSTEFQKIQTFQQLGKTELRKTQQSPQKTKAKKYHVNTKLPSSKTFSLSIQNSPKLNHYQNILGKVYKNKLSMKSNGQEKHQGQPNLVQIRNINAYQGQRLEKKIDLEVDLQGSESGDKLNALKINQAFQGQLIEKHLSSNSSTSNNQSSKTYSSSIRYRSKD